MRNRRQPAVDFQRSDFGLLARLQRSPPGTVPLIRAVQKWFGTTCASAIRTMARTLPIRLHRELHGIEHRHYRRFRRFVKYLRRRFFHEILPDASSMKQFRRAYKRWLPAAWPGCLPKLQSRSNRISDHCPALARPPYLRSPFLTVGLCCAVMLEPGQGGSASALCVDPPSRHFSSRSY